MAETGASGWDTGPSIGIELDVALGAVRDYSSGAKMPPEFGDLLRALPEDWRVELRRLLPGAPGSNSSLLETLAWLAGVQFEGDYARASLAMRDLTLPNALENLAAELQPYELKVDRVLPAAEALADLGTRGRLALYRSAGLNVAENPSQLQTIQSEFLRLATVLKDGPEHSRFWYWLDRFAFEYYHPWRSRRAEQMEQQRQRVVEQTGSLSGHGKPPVLDWLPDQNPLRLFQGLTEALRRGQFRIYFWTEPFGLADSWSIFPGWLLVAFAQPGPLYTNFQETGEDVARRVNALADPTRLIILRLIRHFGMVNTEIARYLGLSRPTVSEHARILREAGLIRSVQVGREMRHEIIPSEAHRLFADLERFLDLPPSEK